MNWRIDEIKKIHRIFGDKCWDLTGSSVDHIPDDSWQIWMDYLDAHGVRTDASINSEYDAEAPRLIVGEDGSSFVRLVNMWGDRYIDIPEEFAARALVLGFLP
jgi:hypothetical protein